MYKRFVKIIMTKIYLQTNVIVADVRYLYEIYPASLSFHRKHQIVLTRTWIGRTNFTNACLSKKQDNVWRFQQVYRTVREVSRKRSLAEGDDGALFLQRRFIFLQVAGCQECIRALPVITLNYSNFNDAARLPVAKHNGRICERLDKETNREYPWGERGAGDVAWST